MCSCSFSFCEMCGHSDRFPVAAQANGCGEKRRRECEADPETWSRQKIRQGDVAQRRAGMGVTLLRNPESLREPPDHAVAEKLAEVRASEHDSLHGGNRTDRKSTRLNSSHLVISYLVVWL